MTLPSHTDVLVVGGGPTGLLVTYILLLGGHKVTTLGRLHDYLPYTFSVNTIFFLSEQYDKLHNDLTIPTYGRACVIFSGTIELLDLVGLLDRMADTAFIIR